MSNSYFILGALSAFVGVFMGGARAHLLEKRLPKERLPVLEVGMRYQVLHSMGILWCWVAGQHFTNSLPVLAAWLFATGIVIFSGAMYTFALTGFRPIMKLTPVGGLVFLSGWACLALSAWDSAL